MVKNVHLRRTVFLVFFLTLAWSGLTGYAQEIAGGQTLMEPLWTTGQTTDTPGIAGMLITDLEGDGENETVGCTGVAPFVLRYASSFYYSSWSGERLNCAALVTGDTDNDGVQEIFVGSSAPFVYVYRHTGATYVRTELLALPGAEGVKGLALANVDADSDIELIVTRGSATLVYDADSLALEWEATGFGGAQVAVANIKPPAGHPLIIVNGADGYYLDAETQTLNGSYLPSFGTRMAVANLDSDAFAEIAWHSGSTVSVLDADSETVKWSLENGSTQWLTVANTDSTPEWEVVTGSPSLGGTIRARNGITGGQTWAFNNAYWGTHGLTVGDADNDGVLETVWGTLDDSGVGYSFAVADPGNPSDQFIHPVWDSPLTTAAGDVDNDGTVELVVVPRSSGVDYYGGSIAVFDSVSHEFEWWVLSGNVDFWDVEVAQLDTDDALEIALVGRANSGGSGRLVVYDGVTRSVEHASALSFGSGPATSLASANIDADAWEELLVGTESGRLYVLDGRTDVIQYQNGTLGGPVTDVEIGNADGDSHLEIAVVTSNSLYLIQSANWAQDSVTPGVGTVFRAAAIANQDGQGNGEILLVGNDPTTGEMRLMLFDGGDLTPGQDTLLGTGQVNDIIVADADAENGTEYVIGGKLGTGSAESPSLLRVYAYSHTTSTLLYDNVERWGIIGKLAVEDLGDNSTGELILGSTSVVQVRALAHRVAPQIDLDPPVINETHPGGPQVTTETLTIANTGDETLTWTLSEDSGASCVNPADVSWMMPSATSGTVPGNSSSIVTLTFDSNGMTAGLYSAALCVASNDPDRPVASVPVTLNLPWVTSVTLAQLEASRTSEPVWVGLGILGVMAGGLWWSLRRT